MQRNHLLVVAVIATSICNAASAEPISVRHLQGPEHRLMVVHTEAGKIIAGCEFSQSVQGDEVSMRLTYKFADGSVDDETTTYRQQGTLRLIRNRHIEKGPFFVKPVDFAVEAASGTATSRIQDRNGRVHIESHHIDLPDDLANGFVGTVLLNTQQNTAPFRVSLLAPVGDGRLIRLLISQEGEQPFHMAGQALRATVFRIHPELGGVVGMIAPLIGLQPKDVMVWVLEGDAPAVVRIVGQLGGYGPMVSSELEGTSFEK